MEILKKILKWVAIALAIILGIIIILIVCMYLFPQFTLFGYRFVRQNSTLESSEVAVVDVAQTYYVVITTDGFDIDISENETENEIQVSYIDRKWGFANVMDSKLFVNTDQSIVSIRTLETSGLVTGTGKLSISMPRDLIPHININTNSGNINIDKAKVASIATDMTDGDFVWSAHNVETTTPEGAKEPVTTTTPINDMTLDSLSIICKGANIDLSCYQNLTINNQLYISADRLSLDFNNLTANVYINCDNLDINIMTLNETDELQIINERGSISIDTLKCNKRASILADSTNIYIRDCQSVLDISTHSSSIEIANTSMPATIATTSGNVEIANAAANFRITTTKGNINVMQYSAGAEIITETGNISMHNVGEENADKVTTISQGSGSINVITQANPIKITSERGSNIHMTIRSMPLNDHIKHEIFNTYGSTNLSVMVADNPFRVRAVGNVSGQLATSVIMSSNNEYIDIAPEGYVGVASEQAHLNVEGGTIHFTAIYE